MIMTQCPDNYRDHPRAALPGQGHEAVLVTWRLGDLEHHLVPLQLGGDRGLVTSSRAPERASSVTWVRVRVNEARARAVAGVDVAAVLSGALHPETGEVFLLLKMETRLEQINKNKLDKLFSWVT